MHDDSLADVMARSLGIQRYDGETDDSFVCRVSYTGMRFWAEAFCLNDGYGGFEGISKSLLTRRLRKWIRQVSESYPVLTDWFNVREEKHPNHVKSICNQLIMTCDLISENEGNTYKTAAEHTMPLPAGLTAVLGLYDPSTMPYQMNDACISGLMIFRKTNEEIRPEFFARDTWWSLPDTLFAWTPLESLGRLEWFNSKSQTWTLRAATGWIPKQPDEEGPWLVRIQADYRDYDYYMVKTVQGHLQATLLNVDHAKDLVLFLRAKSNNPIKAKIKTLDEYHIKIIAPFHLISPKIGRWLELMTWPERDAGDIGQRIIRAECLACAKQLLSENNIIIEKERI